MATHMNSFGVHSSLHQYIQSIKNIPLLDAEQESKLSNSIKKGDQTAKNTMIKSNLRLVVCIASKYKGRGIPYIDLIEEGNLGLIHAVEKFDPNMGARFSTYASWWIRQSIERALMNQSRTIRLPVHFIKKFSKYLRLKDEICYKQKPESSLKEMVEELAINKETLQQFKYCEQSNISLDNDLPKNDHPLHEVLEDEQTANPVDVVQISDTKELFEKWLNKLDPQQLSVIERRFGFHGYEPMSLEKIGREIGLTRERVRQIQNKALRRLYFKVRDSGLSLDMFTDKG